MRSSRKFGYVILFVGIGLLTFCLSNLSYKIFSQDKKMDDFLRTQGEMSTELSERIDKYNSNVNVDETGLVDPFNSEDIELESSKVIDENGIFGYLEIPKINFKKPIYLGASYNHLAKGVGQLDGTSIPVGGKGRRSVLAGHRGWYGDIMLLKVGQLYSNDVVYVHHHGKTLTYKVVGREYISPSDWDRLKPVEDKDMLTILSCDPMYPPFTRRILINCVRVGDTTADTNADNVNGSKDESGKNMSEKSSSNTLDYVLLALTILAWIVLIVNIRKFVLDIRRHRK
ncbi:MAG: class C sortase [Finegoldia magna]|uniref:class C sortase n=1 Tax=Finegoldia magna TaxID=1260 RepID=UPI002906F5BE|nr:class C sortase [Finegoldia magna]MDU5700007.1 class C sortase [Finegoldia magna]